MNVKRIGVLTGGGDCPGLNAVIRAVTKTAIHVFNLEVFGIEDSFVGLLERRIRRLHWADASNIIQLGGTILGTNNRIDPGAYPTTVNGKRAYVDRTDEIIARIHELSLDALVIIGGNGTLTIAHRLAQKGIFCIGIPKTIDNDVYACDQTVGFDTAVKVATEALDRIHTTAMSHHRVMIVEVMGRHSGWIALYAGLASGADVILLPEIPYDLDRVTQFITERSRHGKRFSLICMSEGAYPQGGQPVERRVDETYSRLEGSSLELARELYRRTGLETRATILGHTQRGGNPSPQDRFLATLYGTLAVYALMDPGLRATGGIMVTYWKGRFQPVPLAKVAGKTRKVPLDSEPITAARAVGTCLGDQPVNLNRILPR